MLMEYYFFKTQISIESQSKKDYFNFNKKCNNK